MMKKSTDTQQVIMASPSLASIFYFLGGVEHEVKYMLEYKDRINGYKDRINGYKDRINGYRDRINGYRDIVYELAHHLDNVVKKLAQHGEKTDDIPREQLTALHNSIENPEAENMEKNLLRSNVILIFSYIEVLFCLVTAYQEETDDKSVIIRSSKDNFKKNINQYLLTDKNKYFKEKFKIGGVLTASNLQNLRNGLVHFYSLLSSGIVLSDDFAQYDPMLELFEKNNTIVLSSMDLFELTRRGSNIFINELAYDCQHNNDAFNRKIAVVKKVVESYSAKFVQLQSTN